MVHKNFLRYVIEEIIKLFLDIAEGKKTQTKQKKNINKVILKMQARRWMLSCTAEQRVFYKNSVCDTLRNSEGF